MPLILRGDKGTALTYQEMDGNLTYLEGLSANGVGGIVSVSFSTANGDLIFDRSGALPDLVVNLDGRYITDGSGSLTGNTIFGGDVSGTYDAITISTEVIQDIVGAMVTGNSETGITVTYQDVDGTLDFDVNDFTITLSGDVSGTGTVTDLSNVSITATVADNSHNHIVSNITDFTSNVNSAIDARVTKTFVDALGINATTLGGVSLTNIARTDVVETFTANVAFNENITVTGTVDGRDISIDGTKLDGIESGATADQSASEVPYANTTSGLISTNVQSAIDEIDGRVDTLETDSHTHSNKAILDATTASFTTTDETKLDGIESGATADQIASEVPYSNATSGLAATNVQAAIDEVEGRTDTLETSSHTHANKANLDTINQNLNTANSVTFAGQTINGNITVTGTVDGRDVSVDGTKLDGIESGATADQIASEVPYTNTTSGLVATNVQAAIDEIDGRTDNLESDSHTHSNKAVLDATTASFTTADETKLDGIETGATADQTASEILTALLTVDGATSLLDSDLLDGQQGSYYLDYSNFSNTPTINDVAITISAGSYLSGGGDFTTNQGSIETITINHDTTTRSDTTSSASPAYGATFTAVDSVTTNTTGHVTAINVKTVTIPASDNTDNYVDSVSFNTANGALTLGRTGALPDLIVDLDGRYQESSTALTTSTNFGGDVSGTYNAITISSEVVQDIVGAMVSTNTESGISVVYQDADGTLDFDVNDFTITLSGDVSGSGTVTDLANVSITATVADNSHNHIVANITDFTSNVNSAIDSRVTTSFVNALNVNATTLDSIDSTQFLRNDQNGTLSANLTITGTATVGGLKKSTGENALFVDDLMHVHYPFVASNLSKRVYTPVLSDIFLGRSSQLHVTIDGSPVSQTNKDIIFNGNYDTSYQVAAANTSPIVFDIEFSTNGFTGAGGITYSAGFAFMNFFPGNGPSVTPTARAKDKNGTWTTLTVTPNYVYSGSDIGYILTGFPGNWLIEIEVTITPKVASSCNMTSFEYHGSRVGLSQTPLITTIGGNVFGTISGKSGSTTTYSLSPTTGNITTIGTVDGRDLSVDGAKLDGIESGATADQTATEIRTALLTVDGAGSNIDADLLDGLQGSQYLRNDQSGTISGSLSLTDLTVNTNVVYRSESANVSSVSATTISTFPIATYRSAKYLIQATDVSGTEYQTTEILIVHNGTTAIATEYGTLYTGANPVATFDVSISGGNVLVQTTGAVATQIQYKMAETLTKI